MWWPIVTHFSKLSWNIYIYIYCNCHIIKYIKTYPELCFWVLNAATDRSIQKDLIHKMPSESLITLSSNENALSDVPGWFGTYSIALKQGWLTHQPPASPTHLSTWRCHCVGLFTWYMRGPQKSSCLSQGSRLAPGIPTLQDCTLGGSSLVGRPY